MKKLFTLVLASALLITTNTPPTKAETQKSGEMIYFVMLDRFANGNVNNDDGGLGQNKKVSGLDKSNNGFYHGGDIQGLIEKIPYIKSLGFTAIWITPVVRQIPVAPDGSSAAYHGYWGAGFDQIDPHLGTIADFKNFVEASHQQGLKVILDVVINHTADVINYADGNSYIPESQKPYRDKNGKVLSLQKLAGAKTPISLDLKKSFPKSPFVYPTNRSAKSPNWLNDLTNYHNRGESSFTGESSFLGDFFGLDDVFTEKPEVVRGFIDVYSQWISKTGVDGFRIDTARHVNPEFWNQFLPAIRKVAMQNGKAYFPAWGEIYDVNPDQTSFWTKNANFQEVLDFPLQDRLMSFIKNKLTMQLATLFNDDDLYLRPGVDINNLGTFLGNHDMGRVGSFIGVTQGADIALKQDQLAHALLFTLRGTPIVYYGDEFGLTGGSDKDARQDLFPTQVAQWQTEPRIGQNPIGTGDSFATSNPLQNTIKTLTTLRAGNQAIQFGGQKIRYAGGGVFAFSRGDVQSGKEILFVFNSNNEEASVDVPVEFDSSWNLLSGNGKLQPTSDQVTVTVPALSWAAFDSNSPAASSPIEVSLVRLRRDPLDNARLELGARIKGRGFYSVQFSYKNKSGRWVNLGEDQSPTFSRNPSDAGLYRVFPVISSLNTSSTIQVKAEIRDESRVLSSQIKSLTLRK